MDHVNTMNADEAVRELIFIRDDLNTEVENSLDGEDVSDALRAIVGRVERLCVGIRDMDK